MAQNKKPVNMSVGTILSEQCSFAKQVSKMGKCELYSRTVVTTTTAIAKD